jgi:hypothetical protein
MVRYKQLVFFKAYIIIIDGYFELWICLDLPIPVVGVTTVTIPKIVPQASG